MLAALFSGKAGLLAEPSPCNLAELQVYYSRCAAPVAALDQASFSISCSDSCNLHSPGCAGMPLVDTTPTSLLFAEPLLQAHKLVPGRQGPARNGVQCCVQVLTGPTSVGLTV